MGHLEDAIKSFARELGFDATGLTSADSFTPDEEVTVERVRQGLMEGMPWFTEERARRSARPQGLLPGAKSVISLAMSYYTGEFPPPGGPGPRGRVSRYAWGDDYHRVIKQRLRSFTEGLTKRVGLPVQARMFVDDGPMLDRAAAQRAGVGWFGKNTTILTPRYGSWVFLAEVVTDLNLGPDTPLGKTCGQCVRCMDACPSGAITAPYVLDVTRCISYLTIECRGPIPRQLRPPVGDWVFGCDICQEVCPVNRKVLPSSESAFQQRHDFAAPSLIPLLSLTEEEFRERFRNSPIRRARRAGLQRNVCVALGNIGNPVAVPVLIGALRQAGPLVRSHAAWALGRIGDGEARKALKAALAREGDAEVRKELRLALEELTVPARSTVGPYT